MWMWGTVLWRNIGAGSLALVLFAAGCQRPASPGPGIVDPTSGGVAIWQVSSLERLQPDDAVRTLVSSSISAARGEVESFQLVLDAPLRPARVTLSVLPLEGPGGSNLDPANVALYAEQFVFVKTPSPTSLFATNRSLGSGWYPDGLVPLKSAATEQLFQGTLPDSLDLTPGSVQPVWVDVSVPRDAAAGDYRGTIRATWDGGSLDVTYALRVWNFDLPLQPSLRSSFGAHEPYRSDLKTHQLLLAHRLMPLSIEPADVADLERRGLSAVSLPLTSDSDSARCVMNGPPAAAKIAKAAEPFLLTVTPYIYVADEVDRCTALQSVIREWGRTVHLVNSRIKNLVTMTPTKSLFDDGTSSGRSAVDIWVLLPLMYDAARDKVAEALAKGDEVWSYNALVQDSYSPKWQIDFAPLNFRIQPGLLSQTLSLTGILYWRIDLFSADPWSDPAGFVEKNIAFPGEGMLIYPGQPKGITGPLPSMRLKYLRDGEEDYEYVEILKTMGQGSWALDTIRPVAGSWKEWTRDPQALEQVRLTLGARIDQLRSSSRP